MEKYLWSKDKFFFIVVLLFAINLIYTLYWKQKIFIYALK